MASRGRTITFDDVLSGFAAYCVTSLPALLGLLFGLDFVRPLDRGPEGARPDIVTACFRFDARNYLRVIEQGYWYDPAGRSPVAFFPAFPLSARAVSAATGLDAQEAALMTANLALAAAFVLLAAYTRLRWPEGTPGGWLVLVVFGLWPAGLFFRMPYAESLFLLVMLGFLLSLERGSPLVVPALLAGLLTAVRPVGVAASAAFVVYLATRPDVSRRRRAAALVALAPVCCWGLLAYSAYQWVSFGEPLAFAKTQEHWTLLAPPDRSPGAKAVSLLTLEPVWGVYTSSAGRSWVRLQTDGGPIFNLSALNPLLFVGAALAVGWAAWCRWATRAEVVLGATLLAIPYLTRAYEMSMASHGRFASVVVLQYVVYARLLSRAPGWATCLVVSVTSIYLVVLTALYSRNYLVF